MRVSLIIISLGELLRKYVDSFRSRLGASLNCIIDNIYNSNVPLHSNIWACRHSRNQLHPRYEEQLIFMAEFTPHPNGFLVRGPHDTQHFSLRTGVQRRTDHILKNA